MIHDPPRHEPNQPLELPHKYARPTGPTPIGVFRSVRRPVYGADLAESLEENRAAAGREQLEELLHSGETWTVS